MLIKLFAHYLVVGLFCCSIYSAKAQGEFVVFPNGYVYPEATMARLKRLVDQRNFAYANRAPYRAYASRPQAKGYYFAFTTTDTASAIACLSNSPTPKALIAYGFEIDTVKPLLVVLDEYDNHSGERIARLSGHNYTK